MSKFASKAAPSSSKLRGGYYTPAPIADFLAQWVAESGSRLLEPSCGDGAILQRLVAHSSGEDVVGVELMPEEAAKARSMASVYESDFFAWFDEERRGAFDGVAGNPPYIRFGSWDEAYRNPALATMTSAGLNPSRLTNAWVPFVVASVLAVRPGGRIGLVLPAELMQVGYAAELRAYLVDNCERITIVSFDHLVFDGVLQEVVLLLAVRGQGPASVSTAVFPDASQLSLSILKEPEVRAPLHDAEKWTKYYLAPRQIEHLRRFRASAVFSPLREYADVRVGVVSGRNNFFCMSREEEVALGLGHVTVPLVGRSIQIPGLSFTGEDMAALEVAGTRTRLLSVPADVDPSSDDALKSYLDEGEREGVHEGYKCRIRKRWWEVPSTWVPDGFMLRQISTHPRIVANLTEATSTDTVHRVRCHSDVSATHLAASSFNSATFALSEVMGRSYGGGILELEPSEAEALPVPQPNLVSDATVAKADELSREGRLIDALDLVDKEVLIDGLGIDSEQVLELRSIWEQLSSRRAARGRSSRRKKG